jgi:hypothetical protein
MAVLALVACTLTTTRTLEVTATIPQAYQESAYYPLSEPGPYHVGKCQFRFEDANRDIRPVGISVWYPVVLLEDFSGDLPIFNADPDLSSALYPLILS